MENSIKEDIEIVESIIEEYENCSVPEIDMQVNVTFREKQNNALNHILSDYKRVLKENKQLRTEMNSLKKDISNMYDEEVIISIISDNFNLSRNEVLELLGGEE